MSCDLRLDAPAELTRRAEVARLLGALDGDGEETRIVGGAVRNALLGRPVTEIDLATTSSPEETIRRAKGARLRTVPTGIEHGTVTVLVDGTPFEVTTLREDVETDGRHAIVRFGRDFEQDAQRRDFTINALSIGRDGKVRDYSGGLADLAAGRVRFIGEPRARIREDYLRTLRFFRFSAEYAVGPFDPPGLDAAIRERDGLAVLSRERIRAELLKLLAAPRAVEAVRALAEAGLLLRLTGSVGELGRLERMAGTAGAADPILRLAALAVATAEDAERLRDRLRLVNAEHDRIAVLAQVLARLRSLDRPDRSDARRLAATFGLAPLLDALAIVSGEPRPAWSDIGAEQIARYADGRDTVPIFGRTGADLIREGVSPGPELGRRLAEERRAWMAEGCPT